MNPLYRWLCVLCLLVSAASCVGVSGPNDSVSHEEPQTPGALAEGVTGTVAEEGGRPVEGAMIVPKSLDINGPAIPEIAIFSDKDGRYQWPLRPGRFEVLVRASGYGDVTQQVTVAPRTVATLDFVVRRGR
jgi:hypothetical protein